MRGSGNDPLHLLLTDCLMPVMTGEDLVRRARAATRPGRADHDRARTRGRRRRPGLVGVGMFHLALLEALRAAVESLIG